MNGAAAAVTVVCQTPAGWHVVIGTIVGMVIVWAILVDVFGIHARLDRRRLRADNERRAARRPPPPDQHNQETP